jgi:hypothetical protein
MPNASKRVALRDEYVKFSSRWSLAFSFPLLTVPEDSMSRRGLDFVRSWVVDHVDLSLDDPYEARRAEMLAEACRIDAVAQSIGLQEIEDETGDLEETMIRVLRTRKPIP